MTQAGYKINRKPSHLANKLTTIAAIIFSGSCWYVSDGLNGSFWYLIWIAPIPVLIISFNASAKKAFVISFIAYLIGRLSWFGYLVTVATLIPAIIFTLLLPLIFAFIVIITRKIVLSANSWLSAFAFPVFFTTFEFLVMKFSRDGTAASIAYSQSDFLPVIQLAAVTGISGITFIVTFIPSAIAVAVFYYRQKQKFITITIVAFLLLTAVVSFGIFRINEPKSNNLLPVGLVVLNEKYHEISDHPDPQKTIETTELYAQQITNLASQGAALIVMPERAININHQTDSVITSLLSSAAKQNHVYIITGYTNFKSDTERNSALIINNEGNILNDYNKVHLVTGFEDQFKPGNEIALFKFNNTQSGAAICKDLDFPDYIKEYGKKEISILCIPAWDFITDDWLHSRMAILRGVENGFSEVRAARQGRLTISDYNGKVMYEANCSKGSLAILSGKIPNERKNTIYVQFGNWFGLLNLIAALCFIFLIVIKRNTNKLLHK